uniref:Uncharacterized protein n=1 Tax=viral metagenome TaxID=1070528 RepID=A0A6C0DKD3_9ZZZZ
MTTFGDAIKDVPVDRDETLSPDQELINSIFAPKDPELIPREVKLFLIGAVVMYLLFTQSSSIYKVSKNDNITKVIIVLLVLLVVYGSSHLV